MAQTYAFSAQIWQAPGTGARHFLTLPDDVSGQIADTHPRVGTGFGSVRVEVRLAGSTWRTSVFRDAGRQAYVLPLKKDVRRANNLMDGGRTDLVLTVLG